MAAIGGVNYDAHRDDGVEVDVLRGITATSVENAIVEVNHMASVLGWRRWRLVIAETGEVAAGPDQYGDNLLGYLDRDTGRPGDQ